MTVPAHILRASLDDALEVVALTDTRAKELVASVLADILTLREHDVDEAIIDRLLDALRRCCAYNADLQAVGQRLTCTLDELARVAHHAECSGDMASALNVKGLAAALRPHLTVVADSHDSAARLAAVRELCAIVDATPFDRLAGGGMRRALGPGRHALLMSFVNGQAEPLTQQIIRSTNAPVAGPAGGETIGIAGPPGADGLATPLEAVA